MTAPAKGLTPSTTGPRVNRLSKLQKWVLTQAYRHYCENPTFYAVGEDVPQLALDIGQAVHQLVMGNLMRVINGHEANPEIDELKETPLPSAMRHLDTAHIVAQILGVEIDDELYAYRMRFRPGMQDWGHYSWEEERFIHDFEERYTHAQHNAAKASASRCVRRLVDRELIVRKGKGPRLTIAGVAVAQHLTDINPKPRIWETVNYSATSRQVNRLIAEINAESAA